MVVIVRRSVRPARYSQLGHERTMTLDHAALLQVLEAMKVAEVDDRIKLAAQTIYQALIDAELTSVIGAGPWEHTPTRIGLRNGSRPRLLSTPGGGFGVGVPKLRPG